MLVKFFQHFLKFPKMVIFLILLITIFFISQAASKLFDNNNALIIDNSIEPFMAQESTRYAFYKEVENKFSKSNQIIIATTPKDGNYNLTFFKKIDALSKELRNIDGVKKVSSLLDTPNPKGACSGKSYFHLEKAGSVCESIIDDTNNKLNCITSQNFVATSDEDEESFDEDEGLSGEAFEAQDEEGEDFDEDFDVNNATDTETASVTPTFTCTQSIASMDKNTLIKQANKEIAAAMEKIKKDPFIQKDLISKDHSKIASMLEFQPDAKANSKELQEAVAAVLQKYKTMDIDIAYAGDSRRQYESSRVLSNDMTTILPISLALMAVVLLLSFKSGRGVIVPFSVVSVGIVWTFGCFALLGDELNLVSMILPPLLVSVGSAYIIHVLNHYYHEAGTEADMKTVMAKTLEHTSIPMVVTAFTTLAGFAALMLSPIPAIKQMGFYASFGIASVVVLSLVFAPAILQLLPQPKKIPLEENKPKKKNLVDTFLAYKSTLVGRFSREFIIIWVLVVVVALLGTFNITFSSGNSTFREDLSVAKDLRFIENNFAGTSTISVVLKGKNLQTAQTILDINSIKKFILNPNGAIGKITSLNVDKIYSPVEYLSFHRNGLDNLKDKEVIHFFKDLKKHNGPQFLSEDESIMRFNIRMTIYSSEGFLKLQNLLQAELDKHFKGLDVQLTGGAILTSESEDNIAKGQVQSIVMALGIIFVVLSILFFSFKMGFLALYPNIAAIGLFFGILGWFDVPISVTISVIAAIALGIGVDDTIHFLSHYNHEIKESRNEKEASLSTLRMIGRPMIFTTFTLTLGFIVFALSDMQSQILFGLFTAMTLFICLITDLNFLPSIMARTKIITLWDYLDLEYSDEFIKKISIFKDMSMKETKLTTLMAYTIHPKMGEVIFTEGDVSNEMYIILKGSVEIYLDAEHHEKEITLTDLHQNGIFGEMGLLRDATRSASARANTDSTLLVLNKEVLESIDRRYPKISKKLFLNLARKLLLSLIKSNFLIEENHDFSKNKRLEADSYRSIFENMTEKEKNWLIDRADVETFKKGNELFSVGSTGDFMAIILEGSFDLSVDEEGVHKVQTLTAGYVTGYALIITDQTRRQTTVTAHEDSKVAIISEKLYQEMLEEQDRLASKFNYNMVCLLSDRLQHNNMILHG